MEGIKKKIAQLRTELDAEKEKTEEVERQKKEAISRAETVSVSLPPPLKEAPVRALIGRGGPEADE